jgi:hypothetical protein
LAILSEAESRSPQPVLLAILAQSCEDRLRHAGVNRGQSCPQC